MVWSLLLLVFLDIKRIDRYTCMESNCLLIILYNVWKYFLDFKGLFFIIMFIVMMFSVEP
jgi:hypothetical protein